MAGSEKMGGKARHRRRESWTTDDDFADDDEQFAARYGDVRRSSSGNVLHHTSDTTNRNRRAARKADKGDPSERSRSKARNSGSKANRAARRSVSVTRGEPGRTSPSPATEVDWSGRLAPGYANMDPAVLRQIEKDLNKLARRRNERERAKKRKDQKEAKDSDRAQSRFSGANRRIVHTPLAAAHHERRGSFGGGAGTGDRGTPGTPLSGSKRGSFASVAFGVGSSDDEDHASDVPGSRARSTASEELEDEMFSSIIRRRSSAGAVRKEDLPKDHSRADERDPKSVMDYMAVMSEFLSSKGVHGSLLEDMQTEDPGDAGGLPPMHRTASEVEAAASLATLQRGDSASPAPSDFSDRDLHTPIAVESKPRPTALSPTAAPFVSSADRPPSHTRGALLTPTDIAALTSSPSEVHSTLTKSILHMKGSGSGTLGAGDLDLMAAMAMAGDGSADGSADGDEVPSSGHAGLERSVTPRSFIAAQLAADRAAGNATPPPGEASSLEGSGRLAVRHAGRMLRDALDAAVAAVLDESGAQHLGDAQRASADLLAALEGSLDFCERAVDVTKEDADVERCVAAGRAVVAHTRLSAVLLEEVTAGATGARAALHTLAEAIMAASEAEAAAGEAAEEAAAAAMAEETGEAAEAAAVAEHIADEAANDTAVALVRSAHAGAWVAQHLSVYMRWAKRAAAWAGKPPPPPPPEPGSEQERLLNAGDAESLKRFNPAAKIAVEVADVVYTRAIYDTIIAWDVYISAGVAAVPSVSSSDHTNWSYNEHPDMVAYHREMAERQAAGRRSFLRSLWVQAFIAQYCVQSAFTAGHYARLEDTVGHDWDVKELMRAVMRIIAVAGTVEAQLQELGDVNDAGAPAQLRRSRESTPFMEQPESATAPSLSRQPSLNARAFAAPGSPPSREPSSKALGREPSSKVLGAGMGFGSPVRASRISQVGALEDDTGPKSTLFTSSAAPVTVLPPLPRPAPTAESVAIDYIDALWQSVSQVKTLKYESSIAIGRGGFSTVLKASWRGSTVAVKVLDPKKINGDVVDAIKSEVTAMTANRHPQIVTVLAASVQLPDASIIMEYCARGSLSDVLARARKSPGRLCWRVRLLMASDAACGLAYLHSSANQIAHRDINTQNLLVTEDMRVKIADFGLSRLVRSAREREAKETGVGDKENEGDGVNRDATASKQFEMAESDRDAMSDGLRNCLFHAPEVILAGENTGFGTRADVFSFGCVLWCLATLAPPWEEVQDLYEGLPDYVRFVNTMREVADRVTSGERLPLPPLTSSSSASLNGSTAGGDVPGTVNENEVKVDPGAPQWTPGYVQQDRLAKMISRCFQTAPEERPHMSKILFHLRRMHREEEMKELEMHPPPKDWMGFTPAGVPHMSGVSAGKASQKDGAGQVELTPVESVEGKGDTARNTDEIMASAPRKGSEDHTTPPGMLQVPYGAVVLLFAAAAALAALGDRTMLLLLSVAAVQVFVMRWSSS